MTPDVPKLGKRRQRGVRHRRRFDNNWTFSVATAFLVGVAVTSLQLQRQHVHVHGFFVAPPTQIAINAHRSVKTRTIRPKWNRERTNTASASLFSTSSRKLQLHAGSASGDGDSKVEVEVEVDAKASNTGGAGVAAENANANSVEYSFYDEVTIFVRAGSGGQGASTYRKGVGGQNGPPDGGNGGNGGNVVLMVDDSLNTLAGLSPIAYKVNSFGGSGAAVSAQQGRQRPRFKSFRAEIGCDGGRQMKSGRYGKDVVIRVPPGTVVHEIVEDDGYDDDDDEDDEYGYDDDEHEDDDREPKETLVELGTLLLPEQGGETNHPAEGNGGDSNAVVTRRMRSDMASSYNHKPTTTLVVARGGEGGEGSGINQKGRGLQRPRLSPQGGEKKKLRLTLKLVADVALVGVPNAGKSTFLSKVTRAKPRIADYPFTTVIPNLGVWVPPELFDTDGRGGGGGTGGNGLVLCDVPGLIEGASRGVGLGHAFLRHVERCHVILHLVDATAEDPVENFRMLNGELIKYGTGQLARMPQVVVINKTDAYDNDNSDGNGNNHTKPLLSLEELEAQLKEAMSHSRLMTMSAKEGEGVDDLMVRLSAFVKKVT